ncbi:unnamed protein product [Cochlearia groenlandica]
MEREEGVRRVSYYLWFPLKFIHQTLCSLLLNLFGLKSSSGHNIPKEEKEEVEVVQVSSRGLPVKPKLLKKTKASSGKPGRIHNNPP